MKSMIKPIIVLCTICLVVSVLLAAVNSLTAPVIAEYEARMAAEACGEVMEGGTDFAEIPLPDGLPSTVKTVYKEAGGGYVFKMDTVGFNSGYQIMCGISADGKITGTAVLSHSETEGYGSRTAEKSYTDRYIGDDATLGRDYILSGATKSSTAFKNAIKDAFAAFEILTKEG